MDDAGDFAAVFGLDRHDIAVAAHRHQLVLQGFGVAADNPGQALLDFVLGVADPAADRRQLRAGPVVQLVLAGDRRHPAGSPARAAGRKRSQQPIDDPVRDRILRQLGAQAVDRAQECADPHQFAAAKLGFAAGARRTDGRISLIPQNGSTPFSRISLTASSVSAWRSATTRSSPEPVARPGRARGPVS